MNYDTIIENIKKIKEIFHSYDISSKDLLEIDSLLLTLQGEFSIHTLTENMNILYNFIKDTSGYYPSDDISFLDDDYHDQ